MNPADDEHRPILSVVGPHSGCGKSTFVVAVLRRIPRLGCLKVSPAYAWPLGSAGDSGAIGPGFFLEPEDTLSQPGTDTANYLEAGAARVQRLRHRGDALAAGLKTALDGYPAGMPVIVESSSAAPLFNPLAVLLIVRLPVREMKPATRAILPLVTDLVINAPDRQGSAPAATAELRASYPTLNPHLIWRCDLVDEPLPDMLVRRLETLVGKRRQKKVSG